MEFDLKQFEEFYKEKLDGFNEKHGRVTPQAISKFLDFTFNGYPYFSVKSAQIIEEKYKNLEEIEMDELWADILAEVAGYKPESAHSEGMEESSKSEITPIIEPVLSNHSRTDSKRELTPQSLDTSKVLEEDSIKEPKIEKSIVRVKTPEKNFLEISTISLEEFDGHITTNQNYIDKLLKIMKTPSDILKRVLNRSSLSCSELQLLSFNNEILLLSDLPKILQQGHSLQTQEISFELFHSSCKNWHRALKSPNPIRPRMLLHIQDYFSMISSTSEVSEKEFLYKMLQKIKSQVLHLSQPPKPVESSSDLILKVRSGLSEIFNYYARQQMVGKTRTFESIDNHLKFLMIPKFLSFCKDFEIVKDYTNPKRMSIQVQAIQEIFKNNSDFVKKMHETQFMEAVANLSQFYFDSEYDIENKTKYAELDSQTKAEMFYKVLKLDRPNEFRKKLIACPDFGVNKSRIPEDDLSKKYKFRPEKYKHVKVSIQEWKTQKKNEEQDSKLSKVVEDKRNSSMKSLDFKSLVNANGKDYDLGEIMDDKSEDEEFFKYLYKPQVKSVSESFSMKILKRGKDLSVAETKKEGKRIDNAFKSSSKYLNKSMKYSKK